jgi:hypothetical protein
MTRRPKPMPCPFCGDATPELHTVADQDTRCPNHRRDLPPMRRHRTANGRPQNTRRNASAKRPRVRGRRHRLLE